MDQDAWLDALLPRLANADPSDLEPNALLEPLRQVPFAALVGAIEKFGPGYGHRLEIRLYRAWIAVNSGGEHLFAAWFNLGVALARAGDRAGAALAYSSARALKSDFQPAAVNLGLTLEAIGRPDAALQVWDSALQSDEARIGLLNHKGRLLEGQKRLDEAASALRSSLLIDPGQPDVVQHWLHLRQRMCEWPVLETDVPGLTRSQLLRGSGPLAVLALTDEVAVQREVAAKWIARKMPAAPERLSPPEGYRHDRVRIGYLSSDFCRHAMSYLVAELFERHDRAQFEVFGYCSSQEDGSSIRQRVLDGFDHRRFVRDLSNEQVARAIREDEIDVLIELNGLTAGTRLPALRWRPAPVQATYLGFVGPVPLPELDYLLCDEFVVPGNRLASYRPTPWPIARIYQANDSKREIGQKLTRDELGLPADGFILCNFSNHYKITEEMFDAWMSILRRVDRAVLWLTADNPWSQSNLKDAALRAGITLDRLLFAERTSPELYLRRLELADLFLDTSPYNAGTVASDALRMGLPLVTLSGASFASRMAGSLLSSLGASEGIATSLSDYVEISVALASDAGAYTAYRKHFSNAAWSDTIGNVARFTVDFEAALEGMRLGRTQRQAA